MIIRMDVKRKDNFDFHFWIFLAKLLSYPIFSEIVANRQQNLFQDQQIWTNLNV